jgi:GNAT superfamily N-acetyltransferase
MRHRIEYLMCQPDRVIFVACYLEGVVGWIDVLVRHVLAADPRAEIAGLVVSEGFRSRGLGRILVSRAEQWAVSRGVKEMLVRSRITREEAHRFYLREGYERIKTSAVFTKRLTPASRVN